RPGPEPKQSGRPAPSPGGVRPGPEILQEGPGDVPAPLPQGAIPPGPSRPGHQPEQPGLPAASPGGVRSGPEILQASPGDASGPIRSVWSGCLGGPGLQSG